MFVALLLTIYKTLVAYLFTKDWINQGHVSQNTQEKTTTTGAMVVVVYFKNPPSGAFLWGKLRQYGTTIQDTYTRWKSQSIVTNAAQVSPARLSHNMGCSCSWILLLICLDPGDITRESPTTLLSTKKTKWKLLGISPGPTRFYFCCTHIFLK